MIDIIIPTMWFCSDFIEALNQYVNSEYINKIIIIDNNKLNRPNHIILASSKITLISYNKNIYVNPAWNEGIYYTTTENVGILNDDINVKDDIFKMILDFKYTNQDIIGVNLRGYQNNFKIDEIIDTNEEIVQLNIDKSRPIGEQAWAFGICMFMKKEFYKQIPSLYQIWYGDDYLVQQAQSVYAINTNKIKGKISETIVKLTNKNNDVSNRIKLDSENFLKFNHFKNASNWEMPNTIAKSEYLKFFETEYLKAIQTPSDINENLHILYELGLKCSSITEMGVRSGVSTRAFLNTSAKLISYDIILNSDVQRLFEIAQEYGKDVKYIQANVLNITIEKTDLLFIDTLHTYGQLKEELSKHGNKAKKYLVFHDTNTFGLTDEITQYKYNVTGLLPAIIEFMVLNPQWKIKIHNVNNNGLTVLERFK